MNSRRLWVAACAAVFIACAGELSDPDAFPMVIGGTAAGGTGGMTAGTMAAGTGGMMATGGTGVAGTSAPSCDAEMLLAQRCGSPGCHAAGTQQVDLASPDLASRLLGQSPPAGACMGREFISADGSQSLLLDKIDDAPPCGVKMPLVGSLDDDEIDCIAEWVDSVVGS